MLNNYTMYKLKSWLIFYQKHYTMKFHLRLRSCKTCQTLMKNRMKRNKRHSSFRCLTGRVVKKLTWGNCSEDSWELTPFQTFSALTWVAVCCTGDALDWTGAAWIIIGWFVFWPCICIRINCRWFWLIWTFGNKQIIHYKEFS